MEKVNKNFHVPLCLLPPKINSRLPSATVGLLSLPSAAANLLIVYEPFILTDPSINKLKYETRPRYIAIIEIRCNANVIT